MAINETINPTTRKVSGKFDRTKVMAAVMKSAMAIDGVAPTGSIDNLPRLRAQLPGVLAEFVA